MQHIPDLYADIDLRMLKRKVQALESAITNPKREWVGLTKEEQCQIAIECGAMSADWLDFVVAIEAKLKEKNT
jgi:hypothetical protein